MTTIEERRLLLAEMRAVRRVIAQKAHAQRRPDGRTDSPYHYGMACGLELARDLISDRMRGIAKRKVFPASRDTAPRSA